MCLIIHIPAGKNVSKRIVANATRTNSDGSGVMFSMDNELFFEKKVVWQPRQLAKYLRSLVEYDRTVHFRMATHGQTNEENTHPFVCGTNEGRQWALVHNGIIGTIDRPNSAYSDTWHFAQEMKSILDDDPDVLDKEVFRSMIADYIGSQNKVVFMDNFGKSYIVNEKQGTYTDGCWYSNTYSIADSKPVSQYQRQLSHSYYDYDEYNSYDDYHKHKYLGYDPKVQTPSVSDRLGLPEIDRPFITKFATWHRVNGVWVKQSTNIVDQSEIDTEMEDIEQVVDNVKIGSMSDEEIANLT